MTKQQARWRVARLRLGVRVGVGVGVTHPVLTIGVSGLVIAGVTFCGFAATAAGRLGGGASRENSLTQK